MKKSHLIIPKGFITALQKMLVFALLVSVEISLSAQQLKTRSYNQKSHQNGYEWGYNEWEETGYCTYYEEDGVATKHGKDILTHTQIETKPAFRQEWDPYWGRYVETRAGYKPTGKKTVTRSWDLNWKHGKLDGKNTYVDQGWKYIANYKEGELEGLIEVFDSNGKKRLSATIKNGKLNGDFKYVDSDEVIEILFSNNYIAMYIENGELVSQKESQTMTEALEQEKDLTIEDLFDLGTFIRLPQPDLIRNIVKTLDMNSIPLFENNTFQSIVPIAPGMRYPHSWEYLSEEQRNEFLIYDETHPISVDGENYYLSQWDIYQLRYEHKRAQAVRQYINAGNFAYADDSVTIQGKRYAVTNSEKAEMNRLAEEERARNVREYIDRRNGFYQYDEYRKRAIIHINNNTYDLMAYEIAALNDIYKPIVDAAVKKNIKNNIWYYRFDKDYGIYYIENECGRYYITDKQQIELIDETIKKAIEKTVTSDIKKLQKMKIETAPDDKKEYLPMKSFVIDIIDPQMDRDRILVEFTFEKLIDKKNTETHHGRWEYTYSKEGKKTIFTLNESRSKITK